MYPPSITVNAGYTPFNAVEKAVHIVVQQYVNGLVDYCTTKELKEFAAKFFSALVKDINSTQESQFTITTSYRGFCNSLPNIRRFPMELIAQSFHLQKNSEGIIEIEPGNAIREFVIGCQDPAHYFQLYAAEKATLAIIAACSKILSDLEIDYDPNKMTTFRNYLVTSLMRSDESIPYKFYANRESFLKIFFETPIQPIFPGYLLCQKMVNGIRVTHVFRDAQK